MRLLIISPLGSGLKNTFRLEFELHLRYDGCVDLIELTLININKY